MQMCHDDPWCASAPFCGMEQVLEVSASIDMYWLGLPCLATNASQGKIYWIPKNKKKNQNFKTSYIIFYYRLHTQRKDNNIMRIKFMSYSLVNLDLPKEDW